MNKDFQLLFEYARIKFTSVDNKIAEYFLARSPVKNIEELAFEIGVSTASITRFCKKIGLNNFKEFLFIYQQQLDQNTPQETIKPNHLHNDYMDILKQFDKHFDKQALKKVSDLIHQHSVIHIFGSGFSALAGADFKFRFTRLGKFVEIVQDNDSMRMLSSILNPDALVILISLKGKNTCMINCANNLREKGISIICITANEKSKLLKIADISILTSSLKVEESTGMISAQMPILMAIDNIYYQYVCENKDSIQNWVKTESVFSQ